jgi:hypothetical protein
MKQTTRRSIVKFLILTGLLTMATSGMAADGSSGCGLGWMVLKENSLISSFTRSLINATFSSTFAMTSGTSGCTKHSIVEKSKMQEYFIATHLPQIQHEVAAGSPLYTQALAVVLGCSEAYAPTLRQDLRANYQHLFQSHAPGTAEKIIQHVSANHSKECSVI